MGMKLLPAATGAVPRVSGNGASTRRGPVGPLAWSANALMRASRLFSVSSLRRRNGGMVSDVCSATRESRPNMFASGEFDIDIWLWFVAIRGVSTRTHGAQWRKYQLNCRSAPSDVKSGGADPRLSLNKAVDNEN